MIRGFSNFMLLLRMPLFIKLGNAAVSFGVSFERKILMML